MDTIHETPTNNPSPGAMPQNPVSHHSVYIIAIAVLVLALAGVSFFAFQTSGALSEAKDQITVLEEQLDLKSGQAGESESRLSDAEEVAGYLADKFDELDTILLDTDTNCVDFISWVYDNALFENVPEAQAKYDAWEREQMRTNDVYGNLYDELDAYFPQYGADLDSSIQ